MAESSMTGDGDFIVPYNFEPDGSGIAVAVKRATATVARQVSPSG